MIAPLGMPVVSTVPAAYDSTVIGTGPGELDPEKLHGAVFFFGSGVSASKGTVAGGDWYGNTQNGRFATSITYSPSLADNNDGFRTMISAGN